jgi:hypothetical protein
MWSLIYCNLNGYTKNSKIVSFFHQGIRRSWESRWKKPAQILASVCLSFLKKIWQNFIFVLSLNTLYITAVKPRSEITGRLTVLLYTGTRKTDYNVNHIETKAQTFRYRNLGSKQNQSVLMWSSNFLSDGELFWIFQKLWDKDKSFSPTIFSSNSRTFLVNPKTLKRNKNFVWIIFTESGTFCQLNKNFLTKTYHLTLDKFFLRFWDSVLFDDDFRYKNQCIRFFWYESMKTKAFDLEKKLVLHY